MAPNPPLTRESARQSLRGVYAILNDDDSVVARARAVVGAGIRLLQYRAKHGIDGDRLTLLRSLTREYGALLILNDDANAALAFDCDGVHLGPEDAGFDDARSLRERLGDRIIGISCGRLEELEYASPASVDYLGVGPVYATGSKVDAGEPIGIEGLARIAAATPLPVAAIGGITAGNIAAVRAAGVAMAAVISALAGAEDPAAAASKLIASWAS